MAGQADLAFRIGNSQEGGIGRIVGVVAGAALKLVIVERQNAVDTAAYRLHELIILSNRRVRHGYGVGVA